jgi:hypothetical protein
MTKIYVTAPIARRDNGAIITADAVKCESAEAAVERAEHLSQTQGYLGAWAFSAISNPTYGFEIDEVQIRSCAKEHADPREMTCGVGCTVNDQPPEEGKSFRRFGLTAHDRLVARRSRYASCPTDAGSPYDVDIIAQI